MSLVLDSTVTAARTVANTVTLQLKFISRFLSSPVQALYGLLNYMDFFSSCIYMYIYIYSAFYRLQLSSRKIINAFSILTKMVTFLILMYWTLFQRSFILALNF